MYESVSSAESTADEQSAYDPLELAAAAVDKMAAKAMAKDFMMEVVVWWRRRICRW
jgi:hypothetical protein